MSSHVNRPLIFLFSDIEASTKLWEQFPNDMQRLLAQHDQIVTSAIQDHGGKVIKHTGDGFFSIFQGGTPVDCAITIQHQIASADWSPVHELRVRLALHLGHAEKRGEDYFGVDINRTARLLSAGWGGQILLTPELLEASALPRDAVVETFGVHQLKDLGDPQEILGLVHPEFALREFPPLRTLSQTKHNLPTHATPFLGRERELKEIQAHLTETPCRLLTLIGSGGMGKTRLALQAGAASVESFRDGVFFVPLAPIESAEFVTTSIAEALKFNFYEEKDQTEQLIDYLSNKNLLLIFDNFEHVIEGAHIIGKLLLETPSIKMLVTSREGLQIQGEWVYPIFGLDYSKGPGVDNFESYGAVQLFVNGAQRANPQYAISSADHKSIAEICDVVQGLPLGLELASAWVGMLSLQEIVDEIKTNFDFLETTMIGVPERHRSLRAVFEYSWNLLDPIERDVFSKLSIFHGGFNRDSAKEIAGASIQALNTLLNKSLIRTEADRRYEVVEALRGFAAEKLSSDSERISMIEADHAKYFLNKLSQWEDSLKGSEQNAALSKIGLEIENIRKAWQTAIDTGMWGEFSQAITPLALYYEMRSWFLEGEEQFKQAASALKSEKASNYEILMASLWTRLGVFSHRLGKPADARIAFDRSEKLLACNENSYEMALLQNNIGNLAYTQGNDELALESHTRSLSLRERLGDAWSIATSLSNLGVIEARRSNLGRARELFEDSLTYRRSIEDRFGIATSLNNLGVLSTQLHEYETAKDLHTESLEIRREIEDMKGITESLSNLGVVADALGNYDESITLYEESLKISEEIGDKFAASRTLNNLGYAAYNLGEFEYAMEFCTKALDQNREIENNSGIVLSLSGLANSKAELGQYQSAHEHFLEALKTSIDHARRSDTLEILLGIGMLFSRMEKQNEALQIFNLIKRDSSSEGNIRSSAALMAQQLSRANQVGRAETHDQPELSFGALIDQLLGQN